MNGLWKRGAALAAACALIFSFSACNKNDTADGGASARPKDELVLAVSSEPENGFDPTQGWGHAASSIFHGILFVRNNKMEVEPSIAKGYKVSDDLLTWTVELKDGVKFSDGTPLTADDVIYSYTYAMNSKDSNADLKMVNKVEKVNDTTVSFVLKEAQSTFIDKLMEIGIVPKAVHEKDPQAYAENPIGCGPYVLKQWNKGQQAIAERNENYFGEMPQFKKITLVYLDEDAVVTAVKAGEVDMAKVTVTNANTKVDGYKLVEVASVENQGICFPVQMAGKTFTDTDGKQVPYGNNVTGDPAIRKAINLGVNREQMINQLLNGYGTPAYTGLEQMPWDDPSLQWKDGDVEGAKKLLEDAGWKDTDGDGIREKNGTKAEFEVLYWPKSESRMNLALYLSDYCKKNLGINIIPTQKTNEEFSTAMYAQVGVLSWGEHSPQLVKQLYHSSFAGDGYNNVSYLQNKTVDQHIEDALNAKTDTEANEHWKKAIYDGTTGFGYQGDAAWAWFMNTNHLYLMREGLEIGTPKPQPHGGAILDNISEWKYQ